MRNSALRTPKGVVDRGWGFVPWACNWKRRGPTAQKSCRGYQLDPQARREKVAETIRGVISGLGAKKAQAKLDFASAVRVPQRVFREAAQDRWDLSGGDAASAFPENWFTAAELLEMRQGVTPGGCLDVSLMNEKKTVFLNLEAQLVHKAIKSKELERWRAAWKERVLFYPYHEKKDESEPAFTIQWDEIEDGRLKKRLLALGVEDALDFDHQIDERETQIVKQSGINNDAVKQLLRHRISLGLVTYPKSAEYLVQHYEALEGRVFEKKKFAEHGKRWYEYHRPRDAKIMLAKLRILSPTLIRSVRFVLDDTGYLSDHACLMIQPTKKTARAWQEFSKGVECILGEYVSKTDLLRYCLAFLNSTYAQERLVTGHRPTPKGSYAITESYLKEIPIPLPDDRRTAKRIIQLVTDLGTLPDSAHHKEKTESTEEELQSLIQTSLAVTTG